MTFLLRPPDTGNNRDRRVQNTAVFAYDVGRRQRVQLHWTLPPGMSLHQTFEKGCSSVQERYVVWMAGDATRVERDDYV